MGGPGGPGGSKKLCEESCGESRESERGERGVWGMCYVLCAVIAGRDGVEGRRLRVEGGGEILKGRRKGMGHVGWSVGGVGGITLEKDELYGNNHRESILIQFRS